MPPDAYITLAEVARRIGVSPHTAGKIAAEWPYVMTGKHRRYPADAVVHYQRRVSGKLVRAATASGQDGK